MRFDRPLTPPEAADLGVAVGAGVTATADEDRVTLEGPVPTPERIAAVAAWAARAGRLIAELRTTGGSLEDAYLELVGDDSRESDR